MPKDPLAISDPAKGFCNEAPPSVICVGMSPAGPMVQPAYPMLPENFMACSRHSLTAADSFKAICQIRADLCDKPDQHGPDA